jgi:hypothetical protein
MEVILEESERSPERRERADVEAGEPRPIAAGPLFFLGRRIRIGLRRLWRGPWGTGRGEVYAAVGKDGRGRNCFSNSSTGFLNIQLDPVIVMANECRDI